MSEINKNKKNQLSDLERYVRGEMSAREENAFAKKMQSGSFEEDTEKNNTDYSANKRDKTGSPRSRINDDDDDTEKKSLYIRLAMGAGLLLLISALIIVLIKTGLFDRIGRPRATNSYVTVAVPELPDVTTDEDNTGSESLTEDNTTELIPEDIEPSYPPLQGDNLTKMEERGETNEQTDIDIQSETDTRLTTDGSSESADPAFSDTLTTEGELLSDDNAEALPPVTRSAQPSMGQENFTQYIKDNMIRPADTDLLDNAVVVISFKVLSTGAIDSLQVISSPGNEFSEEAMRLIREGPSWTPAEVNGEKTDEDISLRIVFK